MRTLSQGPLDHDARNLLFDDRILPPISVIIPAFNEEAGVGLQVESVRRVLRAHAITHEIIVVDDGSIDRTAEAARFARARVLRHVNNRGYGASLKTGIIAAKYECIAITDADGTYPAEEIPILLGKLDMADMVVGSRTGATVHIPWVRKPGKLVLGWLANRIAGRAIPDLNSGLRIFRRDCAIQYFPVLSNQFSFTSTITLALLADDYQVIYSPIDYYPRIGRSKITPRHFFDFTILVVRLAMLFQPLRVFAPLVCVLGALGLAKVAFDIGASLLRHGGLGWAMLSEPLLSTSALLMLLGSFQLLLIGMVADGVIRRIARHSQPLVISHGVAVSPIEMDPQTEQSAQAV